MIALHTFVFGRYAARHDPLGSSQRSCAPRRFDDTLTAGRPNAHRRGRVGNAGLHALRRGINVLGLRAASLVPVRRLLFVLTDMMIHRANAPAIRDIVRVRITGRRKIRLHAAATTNANIERHERYASGRSSSCTACILV